MKQLLLVLLSLFILVSCNTPVEVVAPEFTDGSILEGTSPIPDDIRESLEGVYQITQNTGHFGEQVVLKWNRGKLSVFGSKKGIYCILAGGIKDSTLLFEGTWRYAINTETGLIRLTIDSTSGSQNLLSSLATDGSFSFTGAFGIGSDLVSKKIAMHYNRTFKQEVVSNEFYILAHRGGGRNSDYIGASENSIEIIPYAEHFGANGIEIDVKLSKDNVPFLYHDNEINLRLTADSPIWGGIEEFTFPQLKSFVRLKNGEAIPSLEDALLYVLDETELKFVWLDMKSKRNAMPYVIAVQQKIQQLADQRGRTLEIMIGIPDETARDNFLQYTGFDSVFSLCELDPVDVRITNSQVWAPRWTLGTQLAAVREMHDQGKRVFTWTLDETSFISQFIREGEFDGMLTNYPTVVAYYYYAQ
jgi:glycerophosphoryl diester phosphodiesterase